MLLSKDPEIGAESMDIDTFLDEHPTLDSAALTYILITDKKLQGLLGKDASSIRRRKMHLVWNFLRGDLVRGILGYDDLSDLNKAGQLVCQKVSVAGHVEKDGDSYVFTSDTDPIFDDDSKYVDGEFKGFDEIYRLPLIHSGFRVHFPGMRDIASDLEKAATSPSGVFIDGRIVEQDYEPALDIHRLFYIPHSVDAGER